MPTPGSPHFRSTIWPDLSAFLTIPDPVLQQWILSGAGFDGSEFEDVVIDMRVFHGLLEKAAKKL